MLPAEFSPEIDQSAQGDAGGGNYAGCMSALTDDQLEILRRARDDLPMWGGSVATDRLHRDVSEHLVIKVIDSAKSELELLSYSFTSVPVVEALVRARHRGVKVTLVADYKDNVSGERSGKARAALGALVNAGADVRTISVYAIHHDKVIIADRQTVEQSSFNYSDAAARRNSENVMVNWGNPQLAAVFLKHFDRNYRQATPYSPGY